MTYSSEARWSACAFVLTVGCTPEVEPNQDLVPAVSFAALSAACGTVTSPHTRCLAASGGPESVIDAGCAATAGTALGLDWDSFGEIPHEFEQATSTAELLVASTLLIAGVSGMQVGTLLADADMPTALGAELARKQELAGIADTADAGELWYQHLATAIQTTVSDPSLSDDGAVMTFGDGTVSVEDFGEWQGYPTPPTAALSVAGTLIHEASHDYATSHVPCSDDEAIPACDATSEGTFGAASWWLHTWLQTNFVHLDEWTCGDALLGLFNECAGILAKDGYAACDYLNQGICELSDLPENADWNCASG